ncbi:hypothetical protein [Hydrocoleum sp. CS-953]|nr:hypothetical protein [Hydrocoleum sp. CS-953]
MAYLKAKHLTEAEKKRDEKNPKSTPRKLEIIKLSTFDNLSI